MLLSLSKELLENPACYKVERGRGYVPTETATKEEIKIIKAYNEKWCAAREQMYEDSETQSGA